MSVVARLKRVPWRRWCLVGGIRLTASFPGTTPAERPLIVTEAVYGPDYPEVATLRSNLAAGLDPGASRGFDRR